MNIGTAIRAARKAKGWTLEKLAQEAGTDTGNLSRLERGIQSVNEPLLKRIMALLGVSISVQAPGTSNIADGPEMKGLVPLISWVQAGGWCEVSDIYAVGDAEQWLPCPAYHGPRTFALRVRGLSMHNPNERHSFNDGDIIFVDPDRPAQHRSLVVAKLTDTQEATFKQLLVEDDKRFLMALNPSWPDRIFRINGDTEICGVAIAKHEPLI